MIKMSEYDNYILQRFKSRKTGKLETDLAYKCRLYWFKNNFPTHKEVAKNCNTSKGNVDNYSDTYNWKSIKQTATDLKELDEYNKDLEYKKETISDLRKTNEIRGNALKIRLNFLLGEVGAIDGKEPNTELSNDEIKECWEEIYNIMRLLSQWQYDKLRDAGLPKQINDNQKLEADIKTVGDLTLNQGLNKEELDKEYEAKFEEYLKNITTDDERDV